MATQPIEAPTIPDAVIAAGTQEPQTQPADDGRDYEAEARIMGWKPEDEFQEGDKRPREFRSAEDFVKAADEKAGLQKQTIAHKNEKIAFLERQVRRLMQSEQNAYANALNDVKTQMKDAVATGDLAGFEALDRKADQIRQDMNVDGPAHGESPADQLLAFREANPWFDRAALAVASETEVEARLFADRTADQWIAEGRPRTIPPSQFYAELAEAVNERFPMLKHKGVRPKPASDVAPVTTRTTARSAKTGANLPPEAKQTAERYVRQKIPGFAGKTKEQAYELFAQSWKWES